MGTGLRTWVIGFLRVGSLMPLALTPAGAASARTETLAWLDPNTTPAPVDRAALIPVLGQRHLKQPPPVPPPPPPEAREQPPRPR